MAEIPDKSINSLDEATIISDIDIAPIVQKVGSNYVTKKAELGNIGDHIATDMTFSDLQTTSKNLIGAINEASQNGGASEITELDDVNINSSTLANGDALVYDSASSKWVNGEVTPGAVDLSDLGDVAISSPSNDQVLKYNSTSEKWENGTGGGGGASSLDDLSDVDITTPSANQVLKYNDVSGKWENAAESTGVSDLDDLTDVSISSPSDGQVLTYDSNSSTWINSSASGGSGHTIIDSDGTSLTQRSNLQFIGAYSEDNSTDDTTEVNIVRSMTKAEFDLLSDDEKVGIINVTDVTGDSENEFQPVVYSLNEREIGVWTDGRPLYQKTIDFGALPNNTSKLVNHNISNLDITAIAALEIVADQGTYAAFPRVHDSLVNQQVFFEVTATQIGCYSRNTDSSGFKCHITMRYCKTTDTPGSGQWTPQGVPAVHYSEDEQIVGTWIDGSTICERTYTYLTPITLPQNDWYTTDIPNSDKSIMLSATSVSSTGMCFPLGCTRDSGTTLKVWNTRSGTASCSTLIIRYVKSSS